MPIGQGSRGQRKIFPMPPFHYLLCSRVYYTQKFWLYIPKIRSSQRLTREVPCSPAREAGNGTAGLCRGAEGGLSLLWLVFGIVWMNRKDSWRKGRKMVLLKQGRREPRYTPKEFSLGSAKAYFPSSSQAFISVDRELPLLLAQTLGMLEEQNPLKASGVGQWKSARVS